MIRGDASAGASDASASASVSAYGIALPKPVELVLVYEPRPPCEVEYFQHYFQTHHAYWRVGTRMVGAGATIVRMREAAGAAFAVQRSGREPFVWFDQPPLPERYHARITEELWGKRIGCGPRLAAFSSTWNIAQWFPKLQAAFVRLPRTTILDEASIRSIAGDLAFHDEEALSDPRVVASLEHALRDAARLLGPRNADDAGAPTEREILRPWFGWSPFFDLEGSAPWENTLTTTLQRLGRFLVQQQTNWGLDVGGIALQHLPVEVGPAPSLRIYALGGAPVWWSARANDLRGERLDAFRLWPDGEEPALAQAIVSLVDRVASALNVGEFVLETVAAPKLTLLDVRPYSAVFEPQPGAHFATTACLAGYLVGLARGERPARALHSLPRWDAIVERMRDLGLHTRGHGPFHLGPAAPGLAAPTVAAQGGA